jgi:hypothetical protein
MLLILQSIYIRLLGFNSHTFFLIIFLRQLCCIAQAAIQLHQPPNCWDYKYAIPHLVQYLLNFYINNSVSKT